MNRGDCHDALRRKQSLRRPTATRAGGPDAQDRAASIAHAAGPAQCRGGFALGRSSTWIPWVNREVGEKPHSTTYGGQRPMVRQQQVEQVVEVMGLRNMVPQILQQRFQVLLGALLTMKGHQVMKRLGRAGE